VRVNAWNIALAGIAASWGFVSVIVAGLDLGGEKLVFWRCLLAALTLPPLLLVLGRLDALTLRRRRLQVFGLGLLLALHWVLFFETLKRSSVAVAILTVYTAPSFFSRSGGPGSASPPSRSRLPGSFSLRWPVKRGRPRTPLRSPPAWAPP
jgi:hypothetical protein